MDIEEQILELNKLNATYFEVFSRWTRAQDELNNEKFCKSEYQVEQDVQLTAWPSSGPKIQTAPRSHRFQNEFRFHFICFLFGWKLQEAQNGLSLS